MKFTAEKRILPAFPRTPHLPHNPNSTSDDPVAEASEVSGVFTLPVNIEEKLDGASVGMTIHEQHPLIRNRDHIIRKGYYKDTAAKEQFRSIWNWFYDHWSQFKSIQEAGPYSVFGEWCLAQHGIQYTKLPDYFIAYDLYDYEREEWLAPPLARKLLGESGFTLATLYHQGEFGGGYDELTALANSPAAWAEDKAEGIYLKVYDERKVTHRFKMVRPDFVRGRFWNPEKIAKNRKVE